MGRVLSGRQLHRREKRGPCIGKTKRGKGIKLMVLANGQGLPLGVSLHSVSPAEVKLAQEALRTDRVGRTGPGRPRSRLDRLIADRGDDSDPFRAWLRGRGTELICPHRSNRRRPRTQDGRPLRRYAKRWKIERAFAWLGNYRRLVVRWDRKIEIYRAFVHIACLILVCNHL